MDVALSQHVVLPTMTTSLACRLKGQLDGGWGQFYSLNAPRLLHQLDEAIAAGHYRRSLDWLLAMFSGFPRQRQRHVRQRRTTYQLN